MEYFRGIEKQRTQQVFLVPVWYYGGSINSLVDMNRKFLYNNEKEG